MSVCDGCGADSIDGTRRERKTYPQHLMWLCSGCRRRVLNLPALADDRPPPWRVITLSGIAAITTVLVSLILAIGAHL